MIFYCDLQGNLKAFQNETVYQGSNNVTTIYVVAPFNRPVGLNISFTKPNKLVTSPAIMKWVGTLGNVKIPVSFVNIPEQFTDTYNVWAYALPYSITEQSGVVGVSVNAVIADSVDTNGQQAYRGNLTTFTGQFTVAYSALPSPPTDIPTEWTQDKVLDLLNNYYNDAIQKIGEMNTLKTDAKDTLVKAINEVFDEIASTNATIGNLSTLTTDEKTTIVGAINEVDAHADANKAEIGDLSALTTDEKATLVGAINEVDNHADNATTLANNAVATANSAVATANEAKTTAQTAETNANSAVDTANAANATADEAKAIAQGSQRAIGFATLQAAITALNGYSNTQLKVGDNVYIVETGVPDLWVAAVEPNSVAYNYTTNDAFNDDLVENTLVQVGYYKFAYLESDGKPCTVAWQNMTVAASDWVASTEFEDFAYEAKIILTDFVNFSSIPQVVFGLTEATSGNYAPICKAGDKGVYIYSKVNTAITLPTVVTFAPNVHGASMQGGGYTNKGKWVASTTYAIDDLVYTDNGQFVCIEGITSTTSPEQDTQHWQATFVATGKTKNTLTISGQDNGTEVQKTFDGSTAVEIAFDETTMTAKEVDGVLKVGAKGTVPEALPQEASAVKSGSLPTSGWAKTGFQTFWEGTAKCDASTYKPIGTSKELADILYSDDTAYMMVDYNYQYYGSYNEQNVAFSYKNSNASVGSMTGISFRNGNQVDNPTIFITRDGTMYGRGSNFASSAYAVTYTRIGTSTISQQFYTISDTSITANSDILMELTDEGGVKSYSMEAGKMTVIRDAVPTQPIPYTYKVKQTNASGQFTLVNHFVPSIPESPTSLPVTYKKVSGSLPTSGWNTFDEGWKGSNLPESADWRRVTYGNGKFVAVTDGTGSCAYSTDGISWNVTSLPTSGRWFGVTYGDGKFVAVALSTDKGAYSTDGINWNEFTLPTSQSWYSVTYGNGKFVALGGSSTGAYSTDGITWTTMTLPISQSWYGVTYGDGKFVAVAATSDKGAYSTDGINWTEMSMPENAAWFNVVYGNGKFVAITQGLTIAAYSANGTAWSKITLPISASEGIAYGDGKFFVVPNNSNYGAYSTDGINWTQMSMPTSQSWRYVTYGNGKFVAVAQSANGAYWKAAADVTYTISDTDITANTSVKMYLTDEGGVKAQSKASGSITVIRNEVPTTAIPYEYEVEQTSAEGLFEVINAYVPTKTSQLTNDSGFAKTTEANTWTGVQTFSNADGIKTDRVHNLDNNDAWYNFDGSNNRFGSPSRPTIIRTSEARPRAQVPSGETTVTKEIALLEDIPSAGEWVTVTGEATTLTQAGTYQFVTTAEKVQSIMYWDGTTSAVGTPAVALNVNNSSPEVITLTPVVNTDGSLIIYQDRLVKENDAWVVKGSAISTGFKYRKIN